MSKKIRYCQFNLNFAAVPYFLPPPLDCLLWTVSFVLYFVYYLGIFKQNTAETVEQTDKISCFGTLFLRTSFSCFIMSFSTQSCFDPRDGVEQTVKILYRSVPRPVLDLDRLSRPVQSCGKILILSPCPFVPG